MLRRRCAEKDKETEELRDSLAERDADVTRLGAEVQAAARRGEEALRSMSDLHRGEVEGARSRSGCHVLCWFGWICRYIFKLGSHEAQRGGRRGTTMVGTGFPETILLSAVVHAFLRVNWLGGGVEGGCGQTKRL